MKFAKTSCPDCHYLETASGGDYYLCTEDSEPPRMIQRFGRGAHDVRQMTLQELRDADEDNSLADRMKKILALHRDEVHKHLGIEVLTKAKYRSVAEITVRYRKTIEGHAESESDHEDHTRSELESEDPIEDGWEEHEKEDVEIVDTTVIEEVQIGEVPKEPVR